MAHLEKYLYIRRSKLKGAGKGLFTSVDIEKGKRILEYKGSVHQWKDIKHEDGKNAYLMYINRNTVINGLHSTSFGRYANDARGISRVKGLRNNAEYVSEGNRCFMEALSDIKSGDEIYVGYGKEYWDLMRKLHRKKKAKKLRK